MTDGVGPCQSKLEYDIDITLWFGELQTKELLSSNDKKSTDISLVNVYDMSYS